MQIETVAVASLIPDPSNVRKHSAKNIMAIKGSLAKFGQQKPIVVDRNNVVVAGNGTLEAAKELGWETIQVHRTDLHGIMATAFAIADNRTAELAEWDKDALAIQLQELSADLDLNDIGFNHIDAEEFSLDDDSGASKAEKYLVEIEFPNQEAMEAKYQELVEQGLIVRMRK